MEQENPTPSLTPPSEDPVLLEPTQVPKRGYAPLWALRLLSDSRTPLIVGGVVLVVVIGAVFKGLGVPVPGLGSFGSPNIVVFDPVKFINAQRAAASFLAMAPNADRILSMTQVAKQAEAVIQEEAHGSLVLVKQAVVVSAGMPDITDAVLARFGLPTSVPTVTTQPGDNLEDVAPTDSAFSSGKLQEDYRLELKQRTQKLMSDDAKAVKQGNLVP